MPSNAQRHPFRSYPAYKPSGVEWLGDIPEHWRELPIWTLFVRKTERGHEDLELLSVYRDFGVIIKSSRDDNYNKPSLDLSAYLRVEPSDLVTNKMKTWQGSIAISEYEGIVSPAYYTCRPVHKENDRFLHYLLRCEKYITVYRSLSKGIRVNQWDLDYENFRRIPVLLPPFREQRAIATFLDREMARIDALVAKKERLTELLEEKRTAIISQAVTKGLDPKVKMKPSGVECLGEIPEGWEEKRLKFSCTRITKGTTPTTIGKDFTDSGVNFVKVESITDRLTIDKQRCAFIDEETHGLLERSQLQEGNLIIAIAGAIGRIAVVTRDILPANTNQAVGIITLRNTDCDVKWVAYSLLSDNVQEGYRLLTVQSAQENLSLEDVGLANLYVPPREEQTVIADYLDQETAKVAGLIAKVEEVIERLKEYRVALISSAVTGKIDVRAQGKEVAA